MNLSRFVTVLHILFGLAWIGVLLYLALDVAVLGTEETRLRMQMGQDRKARKELVYERERVQADLDRETQPALLRSLVHRLKLPLEQPRRSLAGSYRGPASDD